MKDPYRPKSHDCIGLSHSKAIQMELKLCGTEHLLYGILASDDPAINKLLMETGLSAEAISSTLYQLDYSEEERCSASSNDRASHFDFLELYSRWCTEKFSVEEMERRTEALGKTMILDSDNVNLAKNASTSIAKDLSGSSFISPIHLLLGILSLKNCRAQQVLKLLKVEQCYISEKAHQLTKSMDQI